MSDFKPGSVGAKNNKAVFVAESISRRYRSAVVGDAPQAMAEVQAEWLARLRKEKGILLAARLAGPLVLSTRGRQPGR